MQSLNNDGHPEVLEMAFVVTSCCDIREEISPSSCRDVTMSSQTTAVYNAASAFAVFSTDTLSQFPLLPLSLLLSESLNCELPFTGCIGQYPCNRRHKQAFKVNDS